MKDASRIHVFELRRRLHYNPETGEFRWLHASRKGPANRIAGYLDHSTGYIAISIDGRKYYAHRLAWLYMTGGYPKSGADHIDRDKTNNRFTNLREADKAQNGWNMEWNYKSHSGAVGVYPHTTPGRWNARITLRGKQISLGVYDTVEEAAQARRDAVDRYRGEFGTD